MRLRFGCTSLVKFNHSLTRLHKNDKAHYATRQPTTITVTEAFVLNPLLEDPGCITGAATEKAVDNKLTCLRHNEVVRRCQKERVSYLVNIKVN